MCIFTVQLLLVVMHCGDIKNLVMGLFWVMNNGDESCRELYSPFLNYEEIL